MGKHAYNSLRAIFKQIPSIQTLQSVLHKIPVHPGLNPFILRHLESVSQKMSMKEKVCILMWDEISIQPKCTYDVRNDIICGLEDWVNNRTGKIADHALVFMLRGLHSGWKMPLSYSFCSKQTNTAQLIRNIKEHVLQIKKAGFHVVATVCDQGSCNVAAIKELLLRTAMKKNLKNTSENQTYIVGDQNVIHLYDPPHLIKGIRNNLISKDLLLRLSTPEEEDRFASWDTLKTAWIMDKKINTIRPLLKKITAEHILEDKIKKMRVKYAVQAMSGTIAGVIQTFATSKCVVSINQKDIQIGEEEIATATVVNFFNDLFDSVNGDDRREDANELRCSVTENSKHHTFWVSAKNQLHKM
ncbi:uncharacterized protein LOC120357108 [Solenopsis invicta]|uniref:uncharacterized protein LOC120357108 n=1 Tax=Solenopsis invicta TaxID=13686 RepID=UPI00193CF217|nr:uncharacterized protein LOC120357108 [Solenopsis invicta]